MGRAAQGLVHSAQGAVQGAQVQMTGLPREPGGRHSRQSSSSTAESAATSSVPQTDGRHLTWAANGTAEAKQREPHLPSGGEQHGVRKRPARPPGAEAQNSHSAVSD